MKKKNLNPKVNYIIIIVIVQAITLVWLAFNQWTLKGVIEAQDRQAIKTMHDVSKLRFCIDSKLELCNDEAVEKFNAEHPDDPFRGWTSW